MSDQENKILDTTQSWSVPEIRSKDEVWSSLEKQLGDSDNSSRKGSKRAWWAVAASISVLVASAVFVLFFLSTDIETGVAEIKEADLPDGSRVILNANSRLSFIKYSYGRDRSLTLVGEGFFEVTPGSPFTVAVGDITVEVLGTSFNIYARNDIGEVKCLTGSVEVRDRQQSVVLSPGQAVSASNKGLDRPSSFEPLDAISWQYGKFHYTNTPLVRVVTELEIQYGVQVEAPDMDGRYYSGYFDNTNLENAVKQVFSPMGYSFEILDEKIIIK